MKTKKSEKADLEKKRPLFFSISFVISLGLVFAAFSWRTPVKETIILERSVYEVPDDIVIPITKKEKEEIAPKPFIPEEIVLVDDGEEIDESWIDDLSSEPDDDGFDPYALMKLQDDGKNEEEDVIHQWVDEMPEFPGGMEALLSFIGNSVKYPVIAQETGVKGKVLVSFVINKDGNVSDARVIRSVDAALDKEALRVVNMMPAWRPGMQAGKTVRVSYVVPINFVLQ